ncbi:MAG: PIN domain-containing protein [Armatimonadetes bacterium]|nr:PIN domain-containing protein [Armatimonadota bacterium]
MGSVTAASGERLYLDAQAFIYAVEYHPTYGGLVRPLFRRAAVSDLTVLTSELTLLEVLVQPLRLQRPAIVSAYQQVLSAPGVQVVPVTAGILLSAAQLRADHPSLRTPDAIHAATALERSADHFVTNDRGFRQLPGLPVTLLSDLI